MEANGKTSDKILLRDQVREKVKAWHSDREKVVFDIVHVGHVDYLEKARHLGDRLIVGLNTDDSVRTLKGKDRPINDEISRARVLAALTFVDAVVLFSEDTPYELIKELTPDILVKGSDYLAENIVGADIVISNGGKVETIEFVSGFSTSNIISKIKKL